MAFLFDLANRILRLNGIFGNAELILHYLKAADSLSLYNPTSDTDRVQQLGM